MDENELVVTGIGSTDNDNPNLTPRDNPILTPRASLKGIAPSPGMGLGPGL